MTDLNDLCAERDEALSALRAMREERDRYIDKWREVVLNQKNGRWNAIYGAVVAQLCSPSPSLPTASVVACARRKADQAEECYQELLAADPKELLAADPKDAKL